MAASVQLVRNLFFNNLKEWLVNTIRNQLVSPYPEDAFLLLMCHRGDIIWPSYMSVW